MKLPPDDRQGSLLPHISSGRSRLSQLYRPQRIPDQQGGLRQDGDEAGVLQYPRRRLPRRQGQQMQDGAETGQRSRCSPTICHFGWSMFLVNLVC